MTEPEPDLRIVPAHDHGFTEPCTPARPASSDHPDYAEVPVPTAPET
jgi:hypothetical protein